MDERRKYPRTEINQAAYVSSGGSVMSCVVRNISAEGAAIDVENAASDSSVHECDVAWIQQNRIGVIFVAVPSSGS
jgi:ribosomal protein S1